MTTSEIKTLVAEKLAGQGSAIDAASVLPAILNGIIDAIPEDIPTIHFLVENVGTQTFSSFAEMASRLEITEEQLTMIMAGKCKVFPGPMGDVTLFPTVIGPISALYGGVDIGDNMGNSVVFHATDGDFSVTYSEV